MFNMAPTVMSSGHAADCSKLKIFLKLFRSFFMKRRNRGTILRLLHQYLFLSLPR